MQGTKYSRREFLGHGYYVSTVGHDEQAMWKYLRNQEREDARHNQQRSIRGG